MYKLEKRRGKIEGLVLPSNTLDALGRSADEQNSQTQLKTALAGWLAGGSVVRDL